MYNEYQPCELLAPYVDKFWEFKGEPEYGMRINILPDGCTDFIFTLGEVATPTNGSLVMQPYRSYFVGPMKAYTELVTYAKTVHMLGIRFLPCGLSRFTKLPLYEFANQRINTCDLESPFDPYFTERLCEASCLRDRIDNIENFLIRKLYKSTLTTDRQILHAINRINQHNGKLPIHSLLDDISLCQRQLERKFKQYTGFTPKEYSRIMKFKNAVDLLRASSYDNLLSVAINSGYYDVPHLSKEIKRLSGSCASTFLYSPVPEEVALTYIET